MDKKLIDECDKLSLLKKETHFIFDKEGEFYVGTINEFLSIPSRFSYYDSDSKILNNYKRYDDVYNFIINLEFTPSEWNLGREYDQTFMNEFGMIITLKPNLFYDIIIDDNKKFKGFFNKESIYKKLGYSNYKSFIRNIKLISILS